jgi:ankyrin repeat protein
LIEAIRDRQVGKAAELLKAGADPSVRYIDAEAFLSAGRTGYTALLYASLNGDVEAVKLLLAHKADVTYQRNGKSALYLAAIAGHDEVSKLLKAAGAEGDPEAIRRTNDLIRAACKGFEMGAGEGYPPYPGVARDPENAPTIADALKQGADVNGADPEGYTALMYAANLGLVDNVKTLLANGADPRRKSKRGDTAVSLASSDSSVNREERAQIVQLLAAHREAAR